MSLLYHGKWRHQESPGVVSLGPRAQPGLCTHNPLNTLADWLCDLTLFQEIVYQLNKGSTQTDCEHRPKNIVKSESSVPNLFGGVGNK